MPLFICRVELKGSPSFAEYAQLHTAMANAGFARTISTGDGTSKALPHAMYQATSALSLKEVDDIAFNAARTVQLAVLTLTVQSEGWWGRLDDA